MTELPVFDKEHKQCAPPFQNQHTNPPIVLGKGNSLWWYQCNRTSLEWDVLKINPDYTVFDGEGECISDNLFLYDHFFGKATEKATVGKVPEAARHFKAAGGGYELKIQFKLPKPEANPNSIELCKTGGKCCTLAPLVMADPFLPAEFGTFAEDALRHKADYSRVAGIPLQFETCIRNNCDDP